MAGDAITTSTEQEATAVQAVVVVAPQAALEPTQAVQARPAKATTEERLQVLERRQVAAVPDQLEDQALATPSPEAAVLDLPRQLLAHQSITPVAVAAANTTTPQAAQAELAVAVHRSLEQPDQTAQPTRVAAVAEDQDKTAPAAQDLTEGMAAKASSSSGIWHNGLLRKNRKQRCN